METDGRDREHNGGEDTSNVVRLPRDWLGPREELVPFGPSAWRADAAPSTPASSVRGADVLELTPRPDPSGSDCTQDDFWGGDLDAIPRPVIAPRPSAPPSALSTPPTAANVRWQDRNPPHPVHLGRSLVAAVALAVGAAAAGLALNISANDHSVGRGRAVVAAAQMPTLPAHLATQVPKFARPQLVRVVRVAHRPAHAHHADVAPATTATFVKATTATPASTNSASSTAAPMSSAGTTTAPVSTRPVATTAPTTSNSTGATTASSRTKAGPVGRGAPFGPGQLG